MSVDALKSKEFGHVKILVKKFDFITVNFVKNGHYFGSGMTCDRVLFVLLVSRVILLFLLKEQTRPDRRSFLTKKWPFFTKLAVRNSNSYFLVKVLTCPTSLDVRASTDVKRG